MNLMLFSERIVQKGYFAYLLEFHNIDCKKCSKKWTNQIGTAGHIMTTLSAQKRLFNDD